MSMTNLIIQKLQILSEKEKKAKIIEFSPTVTILTSDENTVGKSTVVKMVLWVLGCEPKFKDSWDIKSLQASLDIQIDAN